MPTRRSTEQYWTEQQWDKLRAAPPLKLTSRGPIPWRLLAYMLDASPEVEPIRKLVGKRLMDSGHLVGAQKQLDRMLMTLWAAGYVKLEPTPPAEEEGETGGRETGRRESRSGRSRCSIVDRWPLRPHASSSASSTSAPQPPAPSP